MQINKPPGQEWVIFNVQQKGEHFMVFVKAFKIAYK